jgi:hypothetical protein
MGDDIGESFLRESAYMAAVAERAMAVIDVCGTADLAAACELMLDAAWEAALTGRTPDGPDQLSRLERLAGMEDPDAEEPDDDTPEVLVFAAQGALYAALWMAYRREQYDSPPSHVGPDTYSALDGVVRFTRDPRPIFIDPRDPPPPDPFEAREREACARDADVAARLAWAEAAATLRANALEQRPALRDDVRAALRDVRAFGMDWENPRE